MTLSAIREKLFGSKSPPPKEDRAGRGQFGEREAEKALKAKGMKLLARNWRHGKDEIDLVFREDQMLIFVEVRTRDDSALAPGVHSLSGRKRAALKRVCKAYLNSLRERPLQIRFDLVEVSLCQEGKFVLHHHQNIPLLG